jgi:hypothetical protein
MIKFGHRRREVIVKLAVFSLLFQAFVAVVYAPGGSAAQISSRDGSTSSLIICSPNGPRRVQIGTEEKSSDGGTSHPKSVGCPICLTQLCCVIAMLTETVPTSLTVIVAFPVAPTVLDILRDHREAIRPARAPPITR